MKKPNFDLLARLSQILGQNRLAHFYEEAYNKHPEPLVAYEVTLKEMKKAAKLKFDRDHSAVKDMKAAALNGLDLENIELFYPVRKYTPAKTSDGVRFGFTTHPSVADATNLIEEGFMIPKNVVMPWAIMKDVKLPETLVEYPKTTSEKLMRSLVNTKDNRQTLHGIYVTETHWTVTDGSMIFETEINAMSKNLGLWKANGEYENVRYPRTEWVFDQQHYAVDAAIFTRDQLTGYAAALKRINMNSGRLRVGRQTLRIDWRYIEFVAKFMSHIGIDKVKIRASDTSICIDHLTSRMVIMAMKSDNEIFAPLKGEIS